MLNWTELLISCIPLFFIIIIWVVIIKTFRKAQKKNKAQFEDKHSEMIGVLKEIRDELKELNKNN